ncbi:MAG TPA: efflux RND transporter periplasmic adaptor subunit [Candidatus Polarisedimenticolaceae bacterium]|nr:efflux RND transporter periplasmic adaptor subunit [Candidatus Polarisedimenticolaceae bacterium]
MTTLQKSLVGVGVIVVAGAIVAASTMSKPKEKGEEVFMAKAALKDLSSFVQATGRIEAKTKVNVQSSVIGEIISLPVKEGDVVKAGDLLVQIDPERYRSEVERLESVVRSQKIAIEQSEVSLANAERQYKRNQALFATSGLVSQEAYERSELDYKTRSIDQKSMHEQLAQAEASLAKAKDELKKTTLRSPIDGTVTALNAEKGEITLTGTMNNPGTVIMVVSDMGEILATVDVDESRVTQVELGQKARIVVDAVGEAHPYKGTVVEIAGSAVQRQGQQTQVFEVKVALDQVDAKLRPGMTAKARIETQNAPGALTVPIQAVMLRPRAEIEKAASGQKDEEKSKGDSKTTPSQAAIAAAGAKGAAETQEAVFVVENKKAHLRPVKSGISDETSVVILEGIKEGDTVVTGPYRALRDLKEGDQVKEKKGDLPKGEDGPKVEVKED